MRATISVLWCGAKSRAQEESKDGLRSVGDTAKNWVVLLLFSSFAA